MKVLTKLTNKYTLFLIVIVIIGIFLRLNNILNRHFFIDEVHYLDITINESLSSIVNINHWIKDHGILYYVFLKLFIFFSKEIIVLRITSIALYLLGVYAILYFLRGQKKWAGLGIVLVYSFYSYFVFLQSSISPFNLALFFGLLSILTLYRIYNGETNHILLFIYLIANVLGFYSDYSFFYIFLFNLLFLIGSVFFGFNKFLIKRVFILNCLTALFILPGLLQFFQNLLNIKIGFDYLNNHVDSNLLNYLIITANTILLKNKAEILSPIILILILVLIFKTNYQSSKFSRTLFFNLLLLINLGLILVFIYFFSKYYFNINIERSFWLLYLLIMFVFGFHFFPNKYANKGTFLLLVFLMSFVIISRFDPNSFSRTPGRVPVANYNYFYLYDAILKNNKFKRIKYLVFIDDGKKAHYMLFNYYVSENFFPKNTNFYQRREMLNKLVTLRFSTTDEVTKRDMFNRSNIAIIIFTEDKNIPQELMAKQQLTVIIPYQHKQEIRFKII